MKTPVQALDQKVIDVLSKVTTATLTTLLIKKGLRNVWLRGSLPLEIRPRQNCWPCIYFAFCAGPRRLGYTSIVVITNFNQSSD